MTLTALPLVKLYVANSYCYNCGMLLTNTIELPVEENDIRERLKEIQDNDSDGYIVLWGKAPFKCSFPHNLDILELNRKLKKLTNKDKNDMKAIARLGSFSIMNIINLVLNKNYIIYENVACEEDLGRKLYEEDRLPFEIPVYLEKYIDFKKLGHEVCEKNAIKIIPEMKLAEKLCSAT
ncbi:MAG: hypothetical protein GX847_11840 [Clostridiales bacterium]|nr:hypothetical protein [Clostridiales bacterium]